MPNLGQLPARLLRKVGKITRRGLQPFRRLVRAAVVGCGAISHDHLDAFEATGQIRVVALCDMNPVMLSRALWSLPSARGYLDYQEMLDDCRPDLVTLCTWPRQHAPMVLAAARAGVKAVLCEKPLALGMAEAEEVLGSCAERGLRLAVGHQHRFNPAFIRLGQLLRNGQLGSLREIYVAARGAVINNGIHALDLARFLLGDPPAVWAEASCQRAAASSNRGVPTEDTLVGTVGFADNLTCHVRGGPPDLPALEVRLVTSQGSVTATPRGITGDLPMLATLLPKAAGENSYYLQARQLVAWLQSRTPTYPADGKQAALTTELTLALYEAARTGRKVSLPLANRGFILDQYWGDGFTNEERS
jgi:predicted dehydrogenase